MWKEIWQIARAAVGSGGSLDVAFAEGLWAAAYNAARYIAGPEWDAANGDEAWAAAESALWAANSQARARAGLGVWDECDIPDQAWEAGEEAGSRIWKSR